MTEQQLGGSRTGEPLADEKSYPLVMDEFQMIKENMALDRFTNIEAFLASTFLSTLIGAVVFYFTRISPDIELLENVNKINVNWSHVRIMIIYCSVSSGSLLALIISLLTKKKAKKSIDRLNQKIITHLRTQNNE